MPFEYYIGKFLRGEGLLGALANVNAPLNDWGVEILEANNAAFSDGGHRGHSGVAWEPWAASTARRHKAADKPDLMVWKGTLAQSLRLRKSQDGPNVYTVRVASRDWKAPLHQKGGYETWGKPGPQRLVIFMSAADHASRNAKMRDHLGAAINGQIHTMGDDLPGVFTPKFQKELF